MSGGSAARRPSSTSTCMRMKRIDYIGVTFRTRTIEEVREIVRLMQDDLWDAVDGRQARAADRPHLPARRGGRRAGAHEGQPAFRQDRAGDVKSHTLGRTFPHLHAESGPGLTVRRVANITQQTPSPAPATSCATGHSRPSRRAIAGAAGHAP